MMESILKTMNSVSSANYLFDMFLSPSAWSSLSSREFPQKALPDDFTLGVMCFHSSKEAAAIFSVQNTLIPHAHFRF